MKKFLTDIRTVAALLMASATFVACSSDDNIIEEQPVQPTGQVYTLTVNASKGGDATTRALALDGEDGKTLNATWATYEDVYVKKGDDGWATSGSLKPQSDGATAVLKGSFSVPNGLSTGDVLTLQFPRSGERDYSGQVGTLADIAEKYDYATASVTVASKDMGEIKIKETGSITFQSQQAIVKFTLIDKSSNDTLWASQLTVSDGTHTYYVTPDFATDELYVALPDISSQTVTLTANVGSRIYTYERADVTFVNGKYYAITVKMTDSTQQLPLTVEALTAGTVTVDIASTSFAGMYYSKNGDTKALIEKSTDIDVNAGDKVQFYGKGTSTQIFSLNTNVSIRGTAQTKVYGNIMSLINETGYTTEKNLPSDSNFGHLFEENIGLTEAPALPAETLATDCYRGMFENCIYLTTAPELAAKTLVTNCYYAMFSGCGYLNYVKCLATSGINENESTTDWLKGVYTLGGALEIDQSARSSWPTKSANGIPTNWIVYDPDVSHPLASVGWGDKKKVVGSDGTIYNSKDDMPADVTPVALILYVGSDTYNDTYTHGLAVAWADENDGATMTFEAAKAAIEDNKAAVPGGKWLLANAKQWRVIFEACGNSTGLSSGKLNQWIGEVGGNQFILGDYYWTSSVDYNDYENEDYVLLFNIAGEWTAFSTWSRKLNGEKYKVRAVLVF